MSKVSKRGALTHPTACIGSPPEHRDWVAGTTNVDQAVRPSFYPRISDTARISPFVTVDSGCTNATTIGDYALVLAHAHIGHDAQIGDQATIGSHAVIGGYVGIRTRAHVGIGAVILPHRIVGADAIVGAGAVVTKDVPPGVTVAGNPARVVKPSGRVHSEERVSVDEPTTITMHVPPPSPGAGAMRSVGWDKNRY